MGLLLTHSVEGGGGEILSGLNANIIIIKWSAHYTVLCNQCKVFPLNLTLDTSSLYLRWTGNFFFLTNNSPENNYGNKEYKHEWTILIYRFRYIKEIDRQVLLYVFWPYKISILIIYSWKILSKIPNQILLGSNKDFSFNLNPTISVRSCEPLIWYYGT